VANRAAPLVTRTLLFISEGSDALPGVPRGPGEEVPGMRQGDREGGLGDSAARRHDRRAPMTYSYRGKQYIVVAIGRRDYPAEN
jgi:hypothetical protein